MAGFEELQHNHLDLKKVPPLDSNRLVTLINHFVVTVVEQLGQMQATVDARLYELNEKINVCVANLVILESKLNSIPGLSNVGPPSTSVMTGTGTGAANEMQHEISSHTHINNNPGQQQEQSSIQTASSGDKRPNEDDANNGANKRIEPQDDVGGGQPSKSHGKDEADSSSSAPQEQAAAPQERDPAVNKFYNMRKYGIPIGAIHQKMRSEGFDPDLYPDLV